MKSGNLNFLEPSGPLQACNGTALPLPIKFGDPFTGIDVNCDSANLSFSPITAGILGIEKQRKDASTGIGYFSRNFPLIAWSLDRFRNKKKGLRSPRVTEYYVIFIEISKDEES